MSETTRDAEARLAGATVGGAMSAGVVTCSGDARLSQVATTMAEHGIHCVVVSDLRRDGPSWGVVSDLDLAGAAAGASPERVAREIAATPVVRVAPDDTLEHAAQLMAEYQTSHLVVVDPTADRPVGVVSTLDVAEALAEA
jgi:CBS domain-containing protein